MPSKYHFSSSESKSDCSDYEDDDGHLYSPAGILGIGAYNRARKFTSKKNGSLLVVIDNNDVVDANNDDNQCNAKQNFFKTHYAPFEPRLFKKDGSNEYRMILPFVSGETYSRLLTSSGMIRDIESQLTLFLSLVRELKSLHAKGFVFLDLKKDNVLYDCQSGESKLIDGGLAVRLDGELPKVLHRYGDDLDACSKVSYHIAPECWTSPGSSVKPAPATSMDVYSLGVMLLRSVFHVELDSDLLKILELCLEKEPAKRPTLESLESELQRLLSKKVYKGIDHYLKAIRSDQSDIFYCIIQQVADRFLLGQRIKYSMDIPDERERSYALSDQSSDEQALYLELAACTFLTYLCQNKASFLDLQLLNDISATLYEGVLLLKCIKDNQTITVSLKINKQACAESFESLVKGSAKLEGFIYNINEPVKTAQQLWKYLSPNLKKDQSEDKPSHGLEQAWGCCIA